MSKLKELEQRLRDEPDNLGLRVMVAGALHDAGRRDDAVELYRSVAIAYRDQGRSQQAITVCRSILELAPGDAACQELLASLVASQAAPRASPPPRPSPSPLPARPSPLPGRSPSPSPLPGDPGDPRRRSSGEMTPLPVPLAYHDADPTTGTLSRLSPSELPPSLREELAAYPEIAGIAAAARQISASLIAANRQVDEVAEAAGDLAGELDTGRMARAMPSASVPPPPLPPPLPPPPTPVMRGKPPTAPPRGKPATPAPPTPPRGKPPTSPPPAPGRGKPATAAARAASEAGDAGDDDEPTLPPPPGGVPRGAAIDDEKTQPRELPTRPRPPSIAPATTATGPLAGAFFAPLPPRNRAAVLQRFRRRMVAAGTQVIRRGEAGHGLFVVVRGRLELSAERSDATRVALGAIAPGEYIGEASLLARAPAAADVTAAVESELLVLAPEDFHDVARAFPALRSELETVAGQRARDHDQRLQP